jgi:hypothetical protein
MTTRYELDRPVSMRPGRGLGLLFAASALAATVACGGGEPGKTTGGKTSTKAPAAAPTPTPDAFPSNLTVGKSTIGDILITSITQEFGTPQLNRSIDGTGFIIAGKKYDTGVGTHANGRMTISFPAGYKTFSGACGIDDYVDGRGSVVFRILAGEKVLYRSPVVKGKMPAATFSVPVSGVTELTLIADDGGDGNSSDHANWVDLKVSK